MIVLHHLDTSRPLRICESVRAWLAWAGWCSPCALLTAPLLSLPRISAPQTADNAVWALEELSLPYEAIVHWRSPDYKGPSSLKEICPMGEVSLAAIHWSSTHKCLKAPAVNINGEFVSESAVIICKQTCPTRFYFRTRRTWCEHRT